MMTVIRGFVLAGAFMGLYMWTGIALFLFLSGCLIGTHIAPWVVVADKRKATSDPDWQPIKLDLSRELHRVAAIEATEKR